jgi:serine protease Do
MENKNSKTDAPKVEKVDPESKDLPATNSKPEIKEDVSKKDSGVVEPKKKSHFKLKAGLGCMTLVILGLISLFLMMLGAYLWDSAYPKTLDWFEGKGVVIQWGRDEESSSNKTEKVVVEDKTIEITSEESTVVAVVDQNMDSVVSIAVNQKSFSPQEGVKDNTSAIGTGFIVDEKGIIMTNEHVVSDTSADYRVVTNDGTEYEVKEIVHDNVNDIAILRIEAQGLNPVSLGDSENLVQGQIVIAIGTPLGEFAGSVTTGVVSGLERSVTTGDSSFLGSSKTFENVIQTDAAINPGNSGGPLLNSAGDVIGINFATTSGADNISFALPINIAKGRLEEFRKYGKFIKPYVGVEYQMITEAQAQYYDDVVAGAFIRRVVDNSPAQAAGILRGDIVTKIGGKDVNNSFSQVIQGLEVGEKVEFEVYRDGEYVKLNVVLAEAD